MLRNYLKIAWKVLLRRKFFTFVSLFGISFTLLVVIVLAAFVNHLYRPTRPGTRFDRSLYVSLIELEGEKGHIVSYPSYHLLDRYVRTMTTPEIVSIHSRQEPVATYVGNQKLELELKYTDAEFWTIMEFGFTEGHPYDSQAVADAAHVAVITERTRRQVFGDRPAVGEYFRTTEGNFRVIGVFPQGDVPAFDAFADIYVPVTISQTAMTLTRPFSNYMAFVCAADKSDLPAIRREFEQRLDVLRKDLEEEWNRIDCRLASQMEMVVAFMFGSPDDTSNLPLVLAGHIGLVILFMLFPAINLVSLNVSRIIERSSEIGVRKAFGASSLTLVGQFIVENILLTLIGGVIAFFGAWVVLDIVTASGLIPFGHFRIDIPIVFGSLLMCLFFGFLSGVLPAYRMSRLHPVEALKGVEG